MYVLHGHNTAHSLWGKMNESHDVIVKRVTHLSIQEREWNRELQLFNVFNSNHEYFVLWLIGLLPIRGTGCSVWKWQKEAVTQTRCRFDPVLVKPKCVWETVVVFNFQKFVYFFQLFVYNFSNKIPPPKRILALPT